MHCLFRRDRDLEQVVCTAVDSAGRRCSELELIVCSKAKRVPRVMTLSVLGYFSRQFDGTFANVANSAKSLAHWTVTFPAIATASCEQKVTGSSAVKDFYAHFNPVRSSFCSQGQSSYSLPTPAYLSLRLGAHHAPKTCHVTSIVVQKYDIHQPSHRTDWLTGSRVVTVMSRR